MTTKKEAKIRGREIRKQREALNLDMAAVAARAQISVPMLSQAERGNKNLSVSAHSRIMEVFTQEIERLRGVEQARNYVGLCESLPFLKNKLPEAKSKLAALEAQALMPVTNPLDDPIVQALLQSHERENELHSIEGQERAVHELIEKAAENVLTEVVEKEIGHRIIAFARDLLAGDPETVKEYEHCIATGDPAVYKIQSIQFVGKKEE